MLGVYAVDSGKIVYKGNNFTKLLSTVIAIRLSNIKTTTAATQSELDVIFMNYKRSNMIDLKIPEKLKTGDTIGIICPSAGINVKAKHRIDNAITQLEKMGFKVKLGKCVFVDDGTYVSGTVSDRVDDIHEMFRDKNVKMILTATGGNHSNQLLRSLDYDLIRNNPKIFIGYSDITVIHCALYSQANLATYYGPCAATQFGEYPEILQYTKDSFLNECVKGSNANNIAPSEKWTDEFLNWFEKKDLSRARKLKKNLGYRWLRGGHSEGYSLPACIMSINRLAGTKYWIDVNEKILILDLLISPGELDYPLLEAYITDLYNLGVFDKIKGLVIGRLCNFTPKEELAIFEKIHEVASGTNYPILSNFDIGHTDPINTVRYGQKILLDSDKNIIKTLD